MKDGQATFVLSVLDMLACKLGEFECRWTDEERAAYKDAVRILKDEGAKDYVEEANAIATERAMKGASD